MWEGKFFVELRQMFGACSSVQNFDVVANTIKTLAKLQCSIPNRFVLRQLDDTPIVAPAGSGWCEDFLKSYQDLCKEIGLELASECPKFDKSFGTTKLGKVLGIWFNTESMCWRLPEEKRIATLQSIIEVEIKENPTLLQFQSLLGRLNVISTMCPFMSIFKPNLNKHLSKLLKGYTVKLTRKTMDDLRVWKNLLSHPCQWIPICPEKSDPPLATYTFTTDAAGFADNSTWKDNIGFGAVGENADGDTIFGYQAWWPREFIATATDNKGKRFGNKTATLEMIAIISPLLLIPEKLKGKHIQLKTDNMACVFGLKDGYMKNDEYASIFIRATLLICAYLGSVIHAEHCHRRTTWAACTADNLTRSSTTTFLEKQIAGRFSHLKLPECLMNWLHNPTDDWALATDLLKHVMNKT
jgi:hypothetical protein